MLMSYQQWHEFNYGSTSYDQALRRAQYIQPIFRVLGSGITQAGLQQVDPMKSTLHGKEKKPADNSPASRLFGFSRKKPKE